MEFNTNISPRHTGLLLKLTWVIALVRSHTSPTGQDNQIKYEFLTMISNFITSYPAFNSSIFADSDSLWLIFKQNKLFFANLFFANCQITSTV